MRMTHAHRRPAVRRGGPRPRRRHRSPTGWSPWPRPGVPPRPWGHSHVPTPAVPVARLIGGRVPPLPLQTDMAPCHWHGGRTLGDVRRPCPNTRFAAAAPRPSLPPAWAPTPSEARWVPRHVGGLRRRHHRTPARRRATACASTAAADDAAPCVGATARFRRPVVGAAQTGRGGGACAARPARHTRRVGWSVPRRPSASAWSAFCRGKPRGSPEEEGDWGRG